MTENNPHLVEIGELTLGEMRLLEHLRRDAGQLLAEIGNLEIRKSRLITQITSIEAQAEATLAGAAQRLGVSNETVLHFTPDGKILSGEPRGP